MRPLGLLALAGTAAAAAMIPSAPASARTFVSIGVGGPAYPGYGYYPGYYPAYYAPPVAYGYYGRPYYRGWYGRPYYHGYYGHPGWRRWR